MACGKPAHDQGEDISMGRRSRSRKDLAELDELIEEITVDAYGEDEQLWAFRQAFEDCVDWPAKGYVIGQPVSVVEIDYDGDPRHGLTAICRREDGSRHVVAASDVAFPDGSQSACYLAAYRKWLNLDPWPDGGKASPQDRGKRKATSHSLDLNKPVELAVLAVKQRAARCRLLGSDRQMTLRATRLWKVVPGHILTIAANKNWIYAGHEYLSGEIRSIRLDVAALGLVPLQLRDRGMWDPAEEYWGEDDRPIDEWAKPIISRGPRPSFEMEQVLPGEDAEDPYFDPIFKSNDLREADDLPAAWKLLMEACQADLRCLDAHAHLGNMVFKAWPKEAILHYEAGLRIGELSLGVDFDGVLQWGWIDNRPFLRCMHAYGLCLWRLGRFDKAETIFERMLWLNPSDNQGVRLLIDDVRAGKAWEDH